MQQQNSTPEKKPLPVWCKPFLAAYAQTGNVRLAAQAAEIDRSTAYKCKDEYEEFAAMWDQAREDASDRLEEEALRRAHDGVKRMKFHQGDPILVPALDKDGMPVIDDAGKWVMVPYIEHEYSDTLLIFLLKGVRPEKYRDNMKVDYATKTTNVTEVLVSTREEAQAIIAMNKE